MADDDFLRGVDWGKLTAFILDPDDDTPKTEGARFAVLSDVIDHAQSRQDRALIEVMTAAWFGYRCHGTLSDGELCEDCGMLNPGPEE